ncbi:MAG: DUF692 domain-containing protein [Verrucomicrobiota bacterium]
MTTLHQNPYGVGIAYRYSVHHETMRHRGEIDLLEISTEDYIVRERRTWADPDERLLREALDTIPGVAHGLSLSIGTVEPLNKSYIDRTNRFLEEHQLSVFSEHLAYHSVDGNDLTMFLAIPFEEVAIQWLKHNYYAVRRAIGRPFALENVTYSFPVPHSQLEEADFLRRLTEETDCTLLLDVTNVFNNSRNHGYDPIEFFDRIPMERISQMHLAGGHQLPDGTWEDSHSAPVMDEVWPLFEEAVRRAKNANIVILERDSKLHPFDEVMSDIRRAREIFYSYRPETAPDSPIIDPGSVNLSEPDPLAPDFANLRAYQRTMMARIAEPDFRESYRRDPFAAMERFDLTDEAWARRVVDTDPDHMHKFQDSWDYFKKEDEEVERDYKNREWQQWASQLENW